MNWTKTDLACYLRRRLKHEEPARREIREKAVPYFKAAIAARRKIQHENRNQTQLYAAVAESAPGSALVSAPTGETPGGNCSTGRFKITVVCRAIRPADWDNRNVKFLQDCLVEAGILPNDSWDILQGQVISLKATSKEDESTTIIIETI